MKKWFPEMYEKIGIAHQFCIFAYWICCFVLFPQYMPLLLMGLWDDLVVASWAECIFFAVNAVVVVLILREFLGDSFFMLRMDLKPIFKTLGIAWLLMIPFWCIGLLTSAILAGNPLYIFEIFPMTETTVAIVPGYMVSVIPVVGILCTTLIVPFGICGLFYAPVFAPSCFRKRWLGYLTVSAALLIPTVADILWRGDVGFNMALYLVRLPMHLLACWTYQKTDNMWSPILCVGGWNLVTALLSFILLS